jgi:hypothetical protein
MTRKTRKTRKTRLTRKTIKTRKTRMTAMTRVAREETQFVHLATLRVSAVPWYRAKFAFSAARPRDSLRTCA